MKNSFSIQRILLLSRIHLSGILPAFIAVYAIILFILIYISIIAGLDSDNYLLSYPYLYFFIGCVYTSSFWGSWANKKKSYSYLMIPASLKEKLIVGLIFTTVVYTIVFSVLYFLTAYVTGNIFHPSFSFVDMFTTSSEDVRLTDFSFGISIFNYVIFQSLFLLGGLFFNKRQFNYTAITVFLLMVLFFPGNIYFLESLTGWRIIGTNSILMIGGRLSLWKSGEASIGILMNQSIKTISYLVWMIIPLLVYVAAYFKLKEKEI